MYTRTALLAARYNDKAKLPTGRSDLYAFHLRSCMQRAIINIIPRSDTGGPQCPVTLLTTYLNLASAPEICTTPLRAIIPSKTKYVRTALY